MTLDILIIEPIKVMIHQVGVFVPTLLTALAILIVGWVVSQGVRKLLDHVLKFIHFDKLSTDVGLTRIMKKGKIKHKPSTTLSCIVYSVMMIMTLIMTVKATGLMVVTDLLNTTLGYVPHVIAGTFVLIIGMLLAKAVSTLIYVTAKNTDMPIPETLARLSKWAIVSYVGLVYFKEIGFTTLFTGVHYTILLTGVVAALALAFGLAGKDVASKYLSVIDRKAK
jgi:hypothetical protein